MAWYDDLYNYAGDLYNSASDEVSSWFSDAPSADVDLQTLLDQQLGYVQPTYTNLPEFDTSYFLSLPDYSSLVAGDNAIIPYTDGSWQTDANLYNKEDVDLQTLLDEQLGPDYQEYVPVTEEFDNNAFTKSILDQLEYGLGKAPSVIGDVVSAGAKVAGDVAKAAQGAQKAQTAYQRMVGQAAQSAMNKKAQGALNAFIGSLALAKAMNPQKALTKSDIQRGTSSPSVYRTVNAIRSAQGRASGGLIEGDRKSNLGGLSNILVKLAEEATRRGLVRGESSGQEDDVETLLSPGEYVIDAEIVSALGDGNTNAGAKKLDEMRYNIREHKRNGGLAQIAPKAKSPEKYMKG